MKTGREERKKLTSVIIIRRDVDDAMRKFTQPKLHHMVAVITIRDVRY